MSPQEHTEAIIAELTPIIIGQQRPAWACCCKAIRGGASTAVAIKPPENDTRKIEPIYWLVEMELNKGESGLTESLWLHEFVPLDELQRLFAKHFNGAGATA